MNYILGIQLNDLLQSQGDKRVFNDDGRYVILPGGKIVTVEEYLEIIKLEE